MESIKELKDELIKQKEAVEQKSGIVNVQNINPSPAEITEGIKSIPSTDLSMSTATEEDVRQGKTFYSGNAQLKTGTAVIDYDAINAIFLAPNKKVTYSGEINYTFPANTYLKRNHLQYNYNKVNVYFTEGIQTISGYAFSQCPNFGFPNLNEITTLQTIEDYAFEGCGCYNFNYSSMPNTVKTFGANAFRNAVAENFDYKLPATLTSCGDGVFRQDTRTLANTLDLTGFFSAKATNYLFANLAFNCDLTFPRTITQIGTGFNYGGCFHNLTFHNATLILYSKCFGAPSTDPISNFYLKTVTFESDDMIPNINADAFAEQHKANNFKIYVQDNVIDKFKSLTNLSSFVDYIFPISQKD